MIPPETVSKILDAAQVADVIGDFVSLKRRGANYVACCPFHNEKTPSFYVSPSKGIWKCFGCGKSGTAVGFVMEHEGMTYPEALKYLARKYNIEIVEKEETPEELAAKQRRESLFIVNDFAEKYFVEQLSTPEGHSVGLAYFRSRGMEEETIRKYGLGWAPKDRHALLNAALAKGYKEEYLVDTGLCIKYDDGRVADRFFDRVMFPIHSVSGRVIGFGGRTLRSDKTIAKYVNSPQSEIYDKSETLYGIWFAKSEITRRDKCYLVEGYYDVLSMHQLGITNVVASSGTSLTIPQIRLIRKFTQNVTIMYDGDSAGIHAALRGIGLVLKEGLNVKVVLLPDGDDPDSYSRKHTLQEVEAFLSAHEQDFIEFKTDLLLSDAGDDPLRRADLINDISDTIAQIPDAVKRTVYAQASAKKFGIDDQIIFGRIRTTREKMLEDDRKAAARERGQETPYREREYVPEERKTPETPAPDASSVIFEVPFLAPAEHDLVWFILNHGLEAMEFESDSEFYDPSYQYTVAEFIRTALESDKHELENSVYRKTYEAFFQWYDSDEAVTKDKILRSLMDGEDRTVAEMTARLTQERYAITVRDFRSALTSTGTMLVTEVPKAILVYQSKRLQYRAMELREQLKGISGADEQFRILAEIQQLNQLRLRIDEKSGRL